MEWHALSGAVGRDLGQDGGEEFEGGSGEGAEFGGGGRRGGHAIKRQPG